MVNVLSLDGKQDPDLMAANASSAALMLSDIPWNGPIGVIRVGRIDGNFVLNPTVDEVNLLWFRLPFCSILNCACIVPMILDIYTAHGPYVSFQHFVTGQLNYHMFGHQQNYNFLQLNHFIYVVWCFAARFE